MQKTLTIPEQMDKLETWIREARTRTAYQAEALKKEETARIALERKLAESMATIEKVLASIEAALDRLEAPPDKEESPVLEEILTRLDDLESAYRKLWERTLKGKS